MAVFADAGRLRGDYLASLRGMNDDFRNQLFIEFDRMMLLSGQMRALPLFRMRRELSAFFDEKLANVPRVTLQMRQDTERGLLVIRDAYVNTIARTPRDMQFLTATFEDVMRRFVAENLPLAEDEGEGQGRCCACNNRPVEVVFQPCRHACMCRQCFRQLRRTGDDQTFKCVNCARVLTGDEDLSAAQLAALCAGNTVNDSTGRAIILAIDTH
jgi:ribosomal protein S14